VCGCLRVRGIYGYYCPFFDAERMCVKGTYDKIIRWFDLSHSCALTVFRGSGTNDSAANLKYPARPRSSVSGPWEIRLTNLRTVCWSIFIMLN
jgi:hypothetical protein